MEKLEHNMILSASGWRKVFAIPGNEKDITTQIGKDNEYISALSASVFADYIKNKTKKENPIVVLGMDTRPTGKEIANAISQKNKILPKGILTLSFCLRD